MVVNNVRGAILARFNSEAEFANALGWTRQRLNRFTTGISEPKLSEAYEMASVLRIDVAELSEFFLQLKSQISDE